MARRKTPEEKGYIDPRKYAYVICIPDYSVLFKDLSPEEKNRIIAQHDELLSNKINMPVTERTAIPIEHWEEGLRVLTHGHELPPVRAIKIEIDLRKSPEPHVEIN